MLKDHVVAVKANAPTEVTSAGAHNYGPISIAFFNNDASLTVWLGGAGSDDRDGGAHYVNAQGLAVLTTSQAAALSVA